MSHLAEHLYSAAQVRELDRRAIEDCAIPGFTLMQRAAEACFHRLKLAWPETRRLYIVCGAGNNGGDGLVLGALALAEGFEVSLELHCDPDKLTGNALQALRMFRDAGGQPKLGEYSDIDTGVIVDALLGTGASRQLAGDYLEAVERINAAHDCGCGVISVDIPSGLHADTGNVLGAAVMADVTISFIGMKTGLMTGRGPAFSGQCWFDDLGVPESVYEDMSPVASIIQENVKDSYLSPREQDAHKNRHGHVLCVGGDFGTSGAIRLAAEAALRSGAGLVSVATRPEVAVAMSQARPELMCAGIQRPEDLDGLIEKADVILLGPGLGQDEWGKSLWLKVMDCRLPLVLDADGLNLLAWNPGSRKDWVLTPHPGEASRLLECEKTVIQHDRVAAVRALAEKFSAVALLKGAGSLVTAENAPVSLCAEGNPGMATGGMGDLLGGIIAAFIAQGIPLLEATRLAVYVHAQAGDAAAVAGERGLLPSDLLPEIRRLVNP